MSNTVQMGKASLAFHEPVYIQSAASIVGKKEGEGPLKHCFDMISEDPRFGTDTWENAESTLQKETAILAIGKAGLKPSVLRTVRCLIHDRRISLPRCPVCSCRLWFTHTLCCFQSLCYCRKRISFSAGVRQPASPVRNLDSDRKRSLRSRRQAASFW